MERNEWRSVRIRNFKSVCIQSELSYLNKANPPVIIEVNTTIHKKNTSMNKDLDSVLKNHILIKKLKSALLVNPKREEEIIMKVW